MPPTYRNHACRLAEYLVQGLRVLFLENELLRVGVLLDKGADIFQFLHKPSDTEFMLHTPRGLRPPAVQSIASSWGSFLDYYQGGWQEILPNGGPACSYKGVEFGLHGEISTVPWDCQIEVDTPDEVRVTLSVRPFRTPFYLRRTMSLHSGQPSLLIEETLTNEGAEPMRFMWGHHPAYGAPFISDACRVDVGARRLVDDGIFPGPENPLAPGQGYAWPLAERDGVQVDMSRVPAPDAVRYLDAYFADFISGWYTITNTELGFGIGLAWPAEVFPYAWFWQEMHAQSGFPWYKSCYVMAIEPFTSIPGAGLVGVMGDTGTHRTLAPGASVEADLVAVFYETTGRVARINRDGTVVHKPGL